MKKTSSIIFAGLMVVAGTQAQTVFTNGIDMAGSQMEGLGMIDASSYTNLTLYDFRDSAVSIGQLMGLNPESGVQITREEDLVPYVGKIFIVSDGTTNFPVIVTADGISAPLIVVDDLLVGNKNVYSVLSNLESRVVAQEELAADMQDFVSEDGLVASGPEGAVQFNEAGQLAGTANLFIHPGENKAAFTATDGYLFRVYKNSIVASSNLIYSVREQNGRAVVEFAENGLATISLGSDGNVHVAGNLTVEGSVSVTGSTQWYLPESGDLSMGTFTQE